MNNPFRCARRAYAATPIDGAVGAVVGTIILLPFPPHCLSYKGWWRSYRVLRIEGALPHTDMSWEELLCHDFSVKEFSREEGDALWAEWELSHALPLQAAFYGR